MPPSTLVAFVALHLAAGAEPCKECWTAACPELKDLGLPMCTTKPSAPKAPAVPKEPPACTDGRVRSTDTNGQCCWPGQAHNGARCVGRPTSCPADSVIDASGEQCALPACTTGMVRAQDKVHCCWPDQAWSRETLQCIGRPSCPRDFALETVGGTDTCTPNSVIQQREADARAAAAAQAARDAAEREAAARAEQARIEAERARIAAEEAQRAEDARLAAEQARAAKRAQDDAIRQSRVQAWEADKADKASSRLTGYAVSGLGGVSLIGMGGAMVGGALQNDRIAKGDGLATASDIEGAATTGFVLNVVAIVCGIGGTALVGAGAGWALLNLDPAEPDLSDLEPSP